MGNFIHRAMRLQLILAAILAVPLPLRAQNPPTNYSPYGTPYDGTESWYCERVSAVSNGRCNFSGITASITSLANLTSASALTTTGTIGTGGAAGAGFNLNLGTIGYTGTLPNAQLSFSLPLSISNGGTGTATPALVAGNGITLSGAFPNTTITAATGAGGVSTPSNPTGITGATQKMLGLAGSVTPTKTGTVMMAVYADWKGSSGASCTGTLRYGTGSAPSNGAVLTGIVVGASPTANPGANAQPVSFIGVVTGLTLTTAYWIDLSVASPSGGTCTVSDVTVSTMEQ